MVEHSQEVAADDNHADAQPAKPMVVGQDRPHAPQVDLYEFRKSQLRDDEQRAENRDEEEREALKDKVRLTLLDIDDENPASSSGSQESDDGGDTEGLENDQSSAPNSWRVHEASHDKLLEEKNCTKLQNEWYR